MEYDQYDTPASIYFAWIDTQGQVRGTSRLNPTDRPYMLKDLWPEMVDGKLPENVSIFEGTRICIDKEIPADLRERIKWEIVPGYLELGLAQGIESYIGVMQTFIWHRVFIQSGWGAEYLGPEVLIDGIRTRAGKVIVSHDALARVRAKTGISEAVLHNAFEFRATSFAPPVDIAA